jgi:ubiquinone/menaquinone biosynthesis C-methylase UbiE
MNSLKFYYQIIFRPKGLFSFLKKYKANGKKILDVGCGNDASFNIKSRFPKSYYVGIDIGDYNLTKPNLADEYLITQRENFDKSIKDLGNIFDIVISSHNLEHCDDKYATLNSMLSVVKDGGYIYIAFPCEKSITFPSRRITLNYYDDTTHQQKPPEFMNVLKALNDNYFDIKFKTRSYRPLILTIIGFFQEPLSVFLKKNLQGTWALYGFETIIWAQKRK